MGNVRGRLVVTAGGHDGSTLHDAFCEASGADALESFNNMLAMSEVLPDGCAACGTMTMLSTVMANLFLVMHEEDHDIIEKSLVKLVKESRAAEKIHHENMENESEAEKKLKKIYKEVKP